MIRRDRSRAPRPDEIARARFSRALFGVHPGEVQRAVLEAAAALEWSQAALARTILERGRLERSLHEASATVRELQQEIAAANATLSAGLDRRRRSTRKRLGQAAASGLRPPRAAAEQPDEIVRVGRQTANTIVAAARAEALEILRAARAAAQAVTQSAEAVIVSRGRGAWSGEI